MKQAVMAEILFSPGGRAFLELLRQLVQGRREEPLARSPEAAR